MPRDDMEAVVYVIVEYYDYDGYSEPRKVFTDRVGAERWIEVAEMTRKSKGFSFPQRFEIFEMEVSHA